MPSAVDYGVDSVKDVVTDLFHLHVDERGTELDMVCPNPGHMDSRPSCSVNGDTGYWNCFSCGVGGDLVALGVLVLAIPKDEVEALLKPRTPEAMIAALRRKLARKVHKPQRKKIVDLPEHPELLDYEHAGPLIDRWFRPETVKLWDLRWVNEVTLTGNKGEFTLSNVIAMPIKDERGRVLAWCYMATPESPTWMPKYLYTPGVELSEMWYGLEQHHDEKHIAIVEGGLDTQWMTQCGYPSLGLLGSQMGDRKVLWLGRYESVTLFPDLDAAGLIWAQRVGDMLYSRTPVYICQYSPWMMKKRVDKDGVQRRATDPEDLFPVDVEAAMNRRVPYLVWRKSLR